MRLINRKKHIKRIGYGLPLMIAMLMYFSTTGWSVESAPERAFVFSIRNCVHDTRRGDESGIAGLIHEQRQFSSSETSVLPECGWHEVSTDRRLYVRLDTCRSSLKLSIAEDQYDLVFYGALEYRALDIRIDDTERIQHCRESDWIVRDSFRFACPFVPVSRAGGGESRITVIAVDSAAHCDTFHYQIDRVPSVGKMYADRIGNTLSSWEDDQLDFPVIFIGDFDPLDQFNSAYYYDLMAEWIDRIKRKNSRADILMYDCINNGARLETNATWVRGMLHYIQNIRVGDEPIILVGYGMGGVVCRYAMELMSGISYFISLDAPHDGANIPLCYQRLIEDNDGGKPNYILSCDAAKQLIRDNVYGTLGRDPFGAYPIGCRTIGVAYGPEHSSGYVGDEWLKVDISWYPDEHCSIDAASAIGGSYLPYSLTDFDGDRWELKRMSAHPTFIPRSSALAGGFDISFDCRDFHFHDDPIPPELIEPILNAMGYGDTIRVPSDVSDIYAAMDSAAKFGKIVLLQSGGIVSLTRDLIVPGNSILLIESQTQIFVDPGVEITVLGSIQASGAILFASSGDSPWKGIRLLNSNRQGFFNGCEIKSAINGIYSLTPYLAVRNCSIHDNQIGLYLDAAIPPLVQLILAATFSVETNDFYQNRESGIGLRNSNHRFYKNDIHGDGTGMGIDCRNGNPSVYCNEIHDLKWGFNIQGAAAPLITANRIYDQSASGIVCGEDARVRLGSPSMSESLANNVIAHNQGFGIELHDRAELILGINNSLWLNGRGALLVDAGISADAAGNWLGPCPSREIDGDVLIDGCLNHDPNTDPWYESGKTIVFDRYCDCADDLKQLDHAPKPSPCRSFPNEISETAMDAKMGIQYWMRWVNGMTNLENRNDLMSKLEDFEHCAEGIEWNWREREELLRVIQCSRDSSFAQFPVTIAADGSRELSRTVLYESFLHWCLEKEDVGQAEKFIERMKRDYTGDPLISAMQDIRRIMENSPGKGAFAKSSENQRKIFDGSDTERVPESLSPVCQSTDREKFKFECLPNPVSEETWLRYWLPEAAHARLAIYNLLGEQIAKPVDGMRVAGAHSLRWRAVDLHGDPLPAGVYLCRLSAGDRSIARRIMILK